MMKSKLAIDANTVSANKQVINSVYYLGKEYPKVLVIGNSITLHAPKEEIGWTGNWGMAASSQNKDFVHLLYEKSKEISPDVRFCILQAAEWERGFWDSGILHNYEDVKTYKPDILVFRLGENVRKDDCKEHAFNEALESFIDFFAVPNKTKIIFTTCFWKYKEVDAEITAYTKKHELDLVELGDLGEDNSMKAIGLFKHSGVAAHPSDKGMKYISNRIWKSLKNKL